MGAAYGAGFGRASCGQHVDKCLARVKLAVKRLQIGLLTLGRQPGVESGVHAADHGDEMRHEHAIDFGAARSDAGNAAQLFVDLRAVAMALDAVGLEIVRRLAEQQADFRLASRSRNARSAVGDQVVSLDQPRRAQQWGVAQLHRGRVTTRVGDDARLGDGLAVEFDQAVRGLVQEFGAGVLHAVPPGEFVQVLQAEVGGQIDDAHAGIDQAAGLRHRHAMRGGEKHHVAGVQGRVVRSGKRQIDLSAQAGEHVGYRHAGLFAGGDGHEFGVRMARQQAQQFHPGVAGAADDADAQTFHGLFPGTKAQCYVPH
ncbi:hypothetical protein GALL_449670 [mine drainage metagenome]|uniref:Uncharacterized protein n=1 Tax=mine drainage metagenome TaxID=410659 RepID=A0A1J5Q7F0_9ZZZZ